MHKLDYSTIENQSRRPTDAMILGLISGPIGYVLGGVYTANNYDDHFHIIIACIITCSILGGAMIFAIIARCSQRLTAKQKFRANIGIVAPIIWLQLIALLLLFGMSGA